jgi:REP element-mobilizing transposase RayT
VTKRINELHAGRDAACLTRPDIRVWQRGYYEHIIRDDESLSQVWQYIADNPKQWALDSENPMTIVPDSEKAWPI